MSGVLDVAGCFSTAPGALASRDLAVSRDPKRRAELCLRLVRAEDRQGRSRHPRSERVACRLQRRRAGPTRDARRVRAHLCRLRISAILIPSFVRPGGVHASRHKRSLASLRGLARKARGGLVRPAVIRHAAPHRRSGERASMSSWRHGGDLGRGPECGTRVLESGGTEHAHVQRVFSGRPGPVPSNRGPRLHTSWRALCHRASQGRPDCSWRQTLPPGSGAYGRRSARSPHWRRGRGVRDRSWDIGRPYRHRG